MLIVMAFTLPFMSFMFEEALFMILLAIILLILATVAIKTFRNRPTCNNQIEQTIEDVKIYF